MAKVHDKRLDYLVKHFSEILGIEKVIITAKEVNFYTPGSQGLDSQPDAIGISRRGDIYIAEYKCHSGRSKAKSQLNRSEKYILNQFGLPVRKFYIHDNYRTEEV